MFLYFDPGLGALILQFLIAIVAGITLFYRSFIAKIKAIFGLKKPEEDIFDQVDTESKSEKSS